MRNSVAKRLRKKVAKIMKLQNNLLPFMRVFRRMKKNYNLGLISA